MSSLPSIPKLFNAWCRQEGDLVALAATLNITPFELLTLTKHPEFIELSLSWQALEIGYLESRARSFREAAADTLREVMHKATDLAERRKSATTLARVVSTLTHGPTRRTNTSSRQRRTPTSTAVVLDHCGGDAPQSADSAASGVLQSLSPPDAQPLSTFPDPQPTRRDLLHRLVNAATLPAEIPPIVSLPPNPTANNTPAAMLIKSAGTCPTPTSHARDAPVTLTPNPLPRTMSQLLVAPRAG